mmetsp:Transcript_18867/g.32248  ORF Transcript_18867/g.32248 Transcript_18867/m.32248 type:complete len:242 (-) Transcript_18867:476-1201(-)
MDWKWLVLVAAACLAVSRWLLRRPEPEPMAKYKAGDVTLETLAQHAGFDYSKPILLAVQGKVYDVTNAAEKYGPGRALQMYAGREVARALALGSTSKEELGSDHVMDLDEAAKQRLAAAQADMDKLFDHVGQVVPPKELTLEELGRHDGIVVPGSALYLAILGSVFDVSKGSQFYGPDGMYPFAGKECARALALMSTEPEDCTDRVEDLSAPERETLRDWQSKFTNKYPVVGRLVADKAEK